MVKVTTSGRTSSRASSGIWMSSSVAVVAASVASSSKRRPGCAVLRSRRRHWGKSSSRLRARSEAPPRPGPPAYSSMEMESPSAAYTTDADGSPSDVMAPTFPRSRLDPVGPRGGLDGRDGNGVDDVLDQGAAGEVVHRLGQPLQHRPDADDVGASLHRLVRRVAGVEVREDEHRGASGDGAFRSLAAGYGCDGGRVVLEGTVHG